MPRELKTHLDVVGEENDPTRGGGGEGPGRAPHYVSTAMNADLLPYACCSSTLHYLLPRVDDAIIASCEHDPQQRQTWMCVSTSQKRTAVSLHSHALRWIAGTHREGTRERSLAGSSCTLIPPQTKEGLYSQGPARSVPSRPRRRTLPRAARSHPVPCRPWCYP